MKKLLVGLVAVLCVVLAILAVLHVVARMLFPWPEPVAGIDLEVQRPYAEPGTLQPDNAFWYFAQLTNRIDVPRSTNYYREGMRGGPYPEFDAALESNRSEIDLFIRAANQTNAMAEGCFEMSCLFPYASPSMNLARLLGYRAERSAFSGDWNSAIDDWRSILRSGLHLQKFPGFLGHLVGVAVIHMAVSSIHRAVEFNHPPIQVIDRLIDELQYVSGNTATLTEAFRVERKAAQNALAIIYNRQSEVVGIVTGTGGMSDLLVRLLYPAFLFLGSSSSEASRHVDAFYTHLIHLLGEGLTSEQAEFKWNEMTHDKHPNEWLSYFNDPVGQAYIRPLVMSIPTIYPRELDHRQSLDFAVLHLKLLRYYLQHHMIPDTDDELADCLGEKIPDDRHLSDRQVRYLREEGGWLFYSVGRDGIDQGGRIEPEPGEMRGSDVGSRFIIDGGLGPE